MDLDLVKHASVCAVAVSAAVIMVYAGVAVSKSNNPADRNIGQGPTCTAVQRLSYRPPLEEALSLSALGSFGSKIRTEKIQQAESIETVIKHLVQVKYVDEKGMSKSATGIQITSDGHVLTAYHVIKEFAQTGKGKLTVRTQEDRTYEAEMPVCYTPRSDSAVIKVKMNHQLPVPFTIKVGDFVARGDQIRIHNYVEGKLSNYSGVITGGAANQVVFRSNPLETVRLSGQYGGAVVKNGELVGIVTYPTAAEPASGGFARISEAIRDISNLVQLRGSEIYR